MKELAEIQKKHFRAMSLEELRQAKVETNREMDRLYLLPESEARDKKLEEMEARLAFMAAICRGKNP